jgi:hypothetical protein
MNFGHRGVDQIQNASMVALAQRDQQNNALN